MQIYNSKFNCFDATFRQKTLNVCSILPTKYFGVAAKWNNIQLNGNKYDFLH